MSANRLTKNEILYVVHAMLSYGESYYWNGHRWNITKYDYDQGAKLANIIDEANIKALKCRYNEDNEAYNFTKNEVKSVVYINFNPIQIIKTCHYIDYQNCEYADYKKSRCHALLKDLINNSIKNLPGYDRAIWGAPEKTNYQLLI